MKMLQSGFEHRPSST